MDCKKARQAIFDLERWDEEGLDPLLAEHVGGCGACMRELNFLNSVQHDLKSFKLPDPGPHVWASMPRRIQCSLMVEPATKFLRREWYRPFFEWLNHPYLAYGLAGLAIVFAVTMGTLPIGHRNVSPLAPIASRQMDVSPVQRVSANQDDPPISQALEILSEPQLKACMFELIKRSFNRRELSPAINDPIVLTGGDFTIPDDEVSLASDFYHMGSKELSKIAYLLDRKYPNR